MRGRTRGAWQLRVMEIRAYAEASMTRITINISNRSFVKPRPNEDSLNACRIPLGKENHIITIC